MRGASGFGARRPEPARALALGRGAGRGRRAGGETLSFGSRRAPGRGRRRYEGWPRTVFGILFAEVTGRSGLERRRLSLWRGAVEGRGATRLRHSLPLLDVPQGARGAVCELHRSPGGAFRMALGRRTHCALRELARQRTHLLPDLRLRDALLLRGGAHGHRGRGGGRGGDGARSLGPYLRRLEGVLAPHRRRPAALRHLAPGRKRARSSSAPGSRRTIAAGPCPAPACAARSPSR